MPKVIQRFAGQLRRAPAYLRASAENPALLRAALQHVVAGRRTSLQGSQPAPLPAPLTDPSLQAALADLARHMGVLVLEQTETAAWIGLAEHNVPVALRRLQALCPMGRVVGGSAPYTDFNLAGRRLRLEPYRMTAPSVWLSGNSGNRLARGLYGDFLEELGLHPISEILGGVTAAQAEARAQVDVVYTWVNHDDPAWQALFRAHAPGAAPQGPDAQALSRFHSNDELRYSLRSVARHLPWVNRIHVFSNCAPPPWLDPAQDRVIWVRHEAVIPPEYLPTFNSHVIETFLHHIPGLSERFLYLNDDVFIGRALDHDAFYAESGQSRAFLEPYGMVSGPVRPGDFDYRNAARNSANLIRQALGFVPTQLHRHTVFALRRSVLNEIETRFAQPIAAMRPNRFRDLGDLNIPSFLYHHYALGTGRAIGATISAAHVKNLDIRWRAQLADLSRRPPAVFCLNEGGAATPSKAWHREVRRTLERMFPHKAPWEKHEEKLCQGTP